MYRNVCFWNLWSRYDKIFCKSLDGICSKSHFFSTFLQSTTSHCLNMSSYWQKLKDDRFSSWKTVIQSRVFINVHKGSEGRHTDLAWGMCVVWLSLYKHEWIDNLITMLQTPVKIDHQWIFIIFYHYVFHIFRRHVL